MLFFVLFSFLNITSLRAQESAAYSSNEVLRFCQESIVEITDDKIYLFPEKIGFFHQRLFLLNDFKQWAPVREIVQDETGWYINMKDPLCPLGHIGIKRVKNIWYCLEDGCPYFIGDNFNR